MEKIIYLVWRDAQTDSETFAQRLRGEVADQLLALGACGLQVNPDRSHALRGNAASDAPASRFFRVRAIAAPVSVGVATTAV